MSCETMVIEQGECKGSCISKDGYYTKEDFDLLLESKQDKLTKQDLLDLLNMHEVIYVVTDCDGFQHEYLVLARN